MKRVALIRYLLVAISLSIFGQRVYAVDGLYFTSTPGSWIGQGQTLSLTEVSASRTFDLGAYTNTVALGAGGYQLNIVGPSNTLPMVGYYGNAYRWPFNGGSPGMWFTAPGRGDNQISGWFNVAQADYNLDGTVQAFAVDFKQFDEASTTNWTWGSVRYNSSIPFPEPASAGAILFMAAPLLARGRRTRYECNRKDATKRRKERPRRKHLI